LRFELLKIPRGKYTILWEKGQRINRRKAQKEKVVSE
jgi:hypothetical protein